MMKWVGSVKIEVKSSVEEVWRVASDFCNMHKWTGGNIKTCEVVEGNPQEVGCVRRCTSHRGTSIFWAKEKLISIDPQNHSYSYSIIEQSPNTRFPHLHLYNYLATFRVTSSSSSSNASWIHWSFEVDPMPHILSEQYFVSSLSSVFTTYIHSLEQILNHASSP